MLDRLDHLVYAVPSLDAAVEDLENRLGVRAVPGGSHPGEGTRNALIALGSGSYLEVLAPDPGQPRPARPLWMGLEGLDRPRLTAWAIKARDVDGVLRRARISGLDLGPVTAGSRRRPDGSLLTWRFTDPHVVLGQGLVPFFVAWGKSAHPADAAPGGVSLFAFRAEHPNPADVLGPLAALGLKLPVTNGPRAALIAGLETPKGFVELR